MYDEFEDELEEIHDNGAEIVVVSNLIEFIEFTYCHDRFPKQAITQKHKKYDPFIKAIQNNGWKTNPLITPHCQ